MPLTWALSLTVTNAMVMIPLLGTVVMYSTTALYSPCGGGQDVEKLVSTWVPLMSN